MGSRGANHTLAPWFAFAGKAFLSAQARQLATLASELRDSELVQGGWQQRLRSVEKALEGEPVELEKEYVRLFLNPAGAPCPPWQSAHGEEPQLMGPAHRSALAWYRAAGVEPKVTTEPADHIGLLLAFFAHLLGTGSDPEIQSGFVEEHLAWMPAFCDRVSREAHHEFYRLLADLTRSLVEQVARD
jgi:TorA maturation chaperone TorD